MAAYDWEEQEQLAQLKAFWSRWGQAILWTLTALLLAYAGWHGWQFWQNRQALQGAALLDELEQAVDGADTDRVQRAWADLQAQAGGTAQARLGALLAARTLAEAGRAEEARAALRFVLQRRDDDELAAVARLRLAGLALDAQQWDEAQRLLEAPVPTALQPWRDDRLGDLRQRQGQPEAAREAYLKAWRGLSADIGWRAIVEAKLNALGVDPSEKEGQP
ncbi:Tetratricopeptide repeat-like domain protein [Tepidimonas alkaliphilus]|uniref:Ancillary SecYEG translocon subunit n=1 Tax=Tepidimonas alkaliphilus TaxID=2588942 RepID=A0A554WDB0_9BURK|nr:tetratricopeptide repeat protein [Tepidimonas alkaliphilus]TSE21569.1 Tetratricopeptide repeat-like domain protein [Tepidimonas alkaliphilus]